MQTGKIIPFPARPAARSRSIFEPLAVSVPFTDDEWVAAILPRLRDAAAALVFEPAELRAHLADLSSKNPEFVGGMIADWRSAVEHLLNVIEVLVEAVDRSEVVLQSRASDFERA